MRVVAACAGDGQRVGLRWLDEAESATAAAQRRQSSQRGYEQHAERNPPPASLPWKEEQPERRQCRGRKRPC